MTNIQSGSDRLSHNWNRLIFPEPLGFTLFLITGFFLLVLLNVRSLWDYLSQNLIGGDSSAVTTSLPSVAHWNDLISSHGRLAVGLFWAAIGFFIYLLLWVGYSFFIGVRNDVVASHYLKPEGSQGLRYWRSALGPKAELLIVAVLSAAFILGCFKVVPIFSQMFLVGVLRTSKYTLIELTLSIAGLALIIHVANILRFFVRDAWGRQLL